MKRFCLFVVCAFSLLPAAHAIDLANEAAPGSTFSVAEGFKAELIYSVPSQEQGSWVSLTSDEYGRLITSDQNGKLYRVTPPSISGDDVIVEPIDLEIGHAQGLLCAFNSLYVMVNGKGAGLYRVQDTDGDDKYDTVELLRAIRGGGEHGPHAVVLSPDKQSIFVCGGNHTEEPDAERSLIPRNWDEDQLLPRQWDARGHATGRLAPGGWIARTNPDGSEFELFCSGFRNEYDIAFNTEGELFSYDADMEWDVGTPWYRPTRVNHCTSGAEFGWRSGTGKWPKYYPDSLGSVVDIGPGSPTGIVFGTGAKFPKKYQRALFISDWSYGVIYSIFMTPDGSSYAGEKVPFVSGAPLPVTDLIVNPVDHAFYFTIGGRNTQSGLYRVTYEGDEPTVPALPQQDGVEERQTRRMLESMHYANTDGAVEKAWPYLSHDDRAIRFAARIAIEHQPVEQWKDKALNESNVVARTYSTIALARSAKRDPELMKQAVGKLLSVPWSEMNEGQKVDLMRALALCFIRLGPEDGNIDQGTREQVTSYLADHFPAETYPLNRELSMLLVYLQSPEAAARTVELLENSPTQEEQIHFAYSLRTLKEGWTDELRQRYFQWFIDAAASRRGGASFGGFLDNIRKEAAENMTDADKDKFKKLIEAKPEPIELTAVARTEVVKEWAVGDLLSKAADGMKGRNFEHGKQHFTDAGCYKCHRFRGDGGNTGPDLTAAGTRFDHKALLESIIEPSNTVSDQYQASQFVLDDGRIVTGRVVNMGGKRGNRLSVMENMLDPGNHTQVDRSKVEEVIPSTVSMMPTGLLNTFKEDEILDLIAFIRSGGNPDHEAFK